MHRAFASVTLLVAGCADPAMLTGRPRSLHAIVRVIPLPIVAAPGVMPETTGRGP